MTYKRGQIWYYDFGDHVFGSHVQHGARPCVIISNDKNNFYSPCVNICPVSTKQDKLAVIHPRISVRGRISCILTEQVKTVDKADLYNYIDILNDVEMAYLDEALKIQFALQ